MAVSAQLDLRIRMLACSSGATSAPNPALAESEVHVWRAELGPDSPHASVYRRLLSADEVARADRFVFEKHRHDFIVSRGSLRVILASYLSVNPASLEFSYSAHGKPSLAVPGSYLAFNASHTEGIALFAIVRSRRIGVDVEKVWDDFEPDAIAERFFSASERAALRGLNSLAKHEAFFTCWTRKEAYIKAHGEGLSLPLDQFDVSLLPDEPARLVSTRPDPAEALHWSLHALPLGPGYAAALVVETQDGPPARGQ
jgi:4'-phosphopantetheinyl transferase